MARDASQDTSVKMRGPAEGPKSWGVGGDLTCIRRRGTVHELGELREELPHGRRPGSELGAPPLCGAKAVCPRAW